MGSHGPRSEIVSRPGQWVSQAAYTGPGISSLRAIAHGAVRQHLGAVREPLGAVWEPSGAMWEPLGAISALESAQQALQTQFIGLDRTQNSQHCHFNRFNHIQHII
jgi:hypothetical protein